MAGLLLLPSLAMELSNDALDVRQILAYVVPAVLSIGAYLLPRLRRDGERPQLKTPLQGFLCVVLGWVLFALIGAVPYWISGALPSFVDGVFESMSGFTTTGASVFTSVEAVPKALLLWRALTQFIGGLGIIALFVAVLPALGAGGVVLFRSEVASKVLEDRLRPRIQDTAKLLWYIYAGLSLAAFLALMLCGMSVFDAACHAMTSVSTGGFSTNDQSLGGYGAGAQWVVILFMFLGGTSFLLHGKAMRGDLKAYWRNEEFALYMCILLAAVGLMVILLMSTAAPVAPGAEPAGFWTSVRDSAFQVTSIMTCCGYASADYDRWPDAGRFLLVVLMLIGACSGSTAGGVKVFRFLLVFRAIGRQLSMLISPSRIVTVRFCAIPVPADALLAACMLLILFVLTTIFGGLVLMLLGVPMLEAVTGTLTCLSCCGPGLGSVGPAGNFSEIPSLGKLVLSLVMLMGRLEFYAVLVLFASRRLRR